MGKIHKGLRHKTRIDETLIKFTRLLVWGLQKLFLVLMTIVYFNDKLYEVNTYCHCMLLSFSFLYIDLDA